MDIFAGVPLPPGGGLGFKSMLAERRERRASIVAGVHSALNPSPLRNSQLRCFGWQPPLSPCCNHSSHPISHPIDHPIVPVALLISRPALRD